MQLVSSTTIVTEYQLGENKYAATELPENNHTQTWMATCPNKKVGETIKNSSTQICHHISKIQCANHTPHDDRSDEAYAQTLDGYLF